MTTESHSKGEHMVLKNDIDYIKQGIDDLKVKVDLTNGRVKSLEMWKAWILGFCAAISLLILPIFFMLLQSKL